LLAAAGGIGCSTRLCDSDMPTSGQLTVSAIDVYGPGGRFASRPGDGASNPKAQMSCAGIDGIAAGTSLGLTIKGQASDRNHTCNLVVADLTAPPTGLSVTGPSTNPTAMAMATGTEGLYVLAEVKTATCGGTLLLELFEGGGAGGLLSQPKDGDYPPAIIYRLFLPSSGTCQPCQDNFSASVSKQ
jgi:hypothetical protein